MTVPSHDCVQNRLCPDASAQMSTASSHFQTINHALRQLGSQCRMAGQPTQPAKGILMTSSRKIPLQFQQQNWNWPIRTGSKPCRGAPACLMTSHFSANYDGIFSHLSFGIECKTHCYTHKVTKQLVCNQMSNEKHVIIFCCDLRMAAYLQGCFYIS